MARARMLARNITKSKKFQQLTNAERVVYLCILPFLDSEGRINAHPTYLKGLVFLHLELTETEIEAAAHRLHDVGLATLYPTEDDFVLEYTGFLEHNRPDRKESPSEFPAPSEELRGRPATIPSSTPKTVAEAMPGQCRGNAAAMPGQSFGNAAPEVEVEVKAKDKDKGEVEAEDQSLQEEPALVTTDVLPPAPEQPPATAAPTVVDLGDKNRNQVFALVKSKLRQHKDGEDMLIDCMSEDPSRDRWFDIPIDKARTIVQQASSQGRAKGQFKTLLIRFLDREAGTDMATATAPPPISERPPQETLDEMIARMRKERDETVEQTDG